MFSEKRKNISAVTRCGDHASLQMFFEDRPKALTSDGMILSNDHRNQHTGSLIQARFEFENAPHLKILKKGAPVDKSRFQGGTLQAVCRV